MAFFSWRRAWPWRRHKAHESHNVLPAILKKLTPNWVSTEWVWTELNPPSASSDIIHRSMWASASATLCEIAWQWDAAHKLKWIVVFSSVNFPHSQAYLLPWPMSLRKEHACRLSLCEWITWATFHQKKQERWTAIPNICSVSSGEYRFPNRRLAHSFSHISKTWEWNPENFRKSVFQKYSPKPENEIIAWSHNVVSTCGKELCFN